MPEQRDILEEFIYFVISKKTHKIIYIGETEKGITRVYANKYAKSKDNYVKVISSKKIKSLKNYYFRKYYEARWIFKFKPKGNKQFRKVDQLNWFLLKMYLRYENPTPDYLGLFSTYRPFLKNKLFNPVQNKFIENKYSKINIDMNKILYINDILAIKFLINENIKVNESNKYRNVFKVRNEHILSR